MLTEHDLAIAPSTYWAHNAQPVSDADWEDAHMTQRRPGCVAGQPQPLWGRQAGHRDAQGRLPGDHAKVSRGHGRIEYRFTRAVPAPEDLAFPHVAQVVVVEREVADLADRAGSTETSYYVTSLKPSQAGAARLAQLIRGHWQIENRLHWVRDVTYDEDRSQLRTGAAPRVLASLRDLAIGALRHAGATNVAKGLRWASRNPQRALTLLGLWARQARNSRMPCTWSSGSIKV